MKETELKKRFANIEDSHFTWQKTVRAHNTVVDSQIQELVDENNRLSRRLDLAEKQLLNILKRIREIEPLVYEANC